MLPLSIANSLDCRTSQSSVKRIVSYTQHTLDVAGECITSCTVQDKPVKIKFMILNGPVTPALGRNTC